VFAAASTMASTIESPIARADNCGALLKFVAFMGYQPQL
jgi:hypothetical protein